MKMRPFRYVKSVVERAMDKTSSPEPIYHVCCGGMIFSYLVALPEERRHLEHQQQLQHAKEHGTASH